MKVEEKIRELSLTKSRLHELQREIIVAIFQDHPKLERITYSAEEEYNDHNYSTRVYLRSVNGVEWSDEDETNIKYLKDIDDEYPEYRAWLVEAKFTHEEFMNIMDALSYVEPSYLQNYEELRRENFQP